MKSEQMWVDWCKNQFALIKLGGLWVVPRSGLSFRKTLNGFNLVDVATPVSEPFGQYQKTDFQCIARHFKEAGLKVTDQQDLLSQINGRN